MSNQGGGKIEHSVTCLNKMAEELNVAPGCSIVRGSKAAIVRGSLEHQQHRVVLERAVNEMTFMRWRDERLREHINASSVGNIITRCVGNPYNRCSKRRL